MSKKKAFKTFKVKRSKGRLYKKRKSTGRKVFEVILMVLVVGVLGVVGYSAAGPLISYFQGDGSESVTTPWEPPESSTPEESETTTDSESSADTTTQPISDGSGAYLLPESALANQTALTQALDMAEKAGCSVVIVPVKDNEGHLLYRSMLSSVKDTDIVTGSMAAAQITSLIKSRGFAAAKALVPTLLDKTAPQFVPDTAYRFADDSYAWLDATPENGGKQWVDPFRSGTRTYYSQLTKELTGAGFDEVLLSELKFPAFTTYDQTILDGHFFASTRYTSLSGLYTAVNSTSGSKAAVAVDIKDVLDGYGKSFGGNAEILRDRSFTGTVYLMIDLTAFGTSLNTGDNTKINLPADPVQKVNALLSQAAKYMGTNITVIPVVEAKGISPEAIGKCYAALAAE